MNPYTPLPNDELRRGELTLLVERVFPDQVAFSFNNGTGPFTISHAEFATKAQGSFRGGAELWRGGEKLWPVAAVEPTEEPAPVATASVATSGPSGSHNTHARLSPSDSKRWTNCTASIAFQEANAHRVVDRSSPEADEGTEAHDWAAKLLMGEVAPVDIPDNFRDYVTGYAAHCMALVPDAERTHLENCINDVSMGFEPPESAFFVEEEVPLFYQEEQTGTADFIALIADGGHVTHVFGRDYKHGAGVLVTAAENTQLAIYVFSAITRLEQAYQFSDDTMVDMAIVQPRHREADSQTPWVMTLADLRTFCREIEYAAITAREAANRVREKIGSPGRDIHTGEIIEAAPGSAFSPSEGDSGACRWCKCKAFCDARLQALTEGIESPETDPAAMLAAMPDLSKEEAKLPPLERIQARLGSVVTDEFLVAVVAHAKGFKSFLADAEEYLENRLLAGDEIPGVKLVDGRKGDREWANADAADVFLRNQGLKQDERYNYKLKSPSQVEALLKDKLKNTRTKNRFNELVTRSDGRKKLAIESDERQAVAPIIAAMPVVDEEEFEV